VPGGGDRAPGGGDGEGVEPEPRQQVVAAEEPLRAALDERRMVGALGRQLVRRGRLGGALLVDRAPEVVEDAAAERLEAREDDVALRIDTGDRARLAVEDGEAGGADRRLQLGQLRHRERALGHEGGPVRLRYVDQAGGSRK
jgi:hypothetical protein